MTQKELIEFCKENDPNYNKDASFVILEPFWNKSAIGITESEWKRGIYICIDVKGKEGYKRYDKRVFYLKCDYPKASQIATFDTHYKKFFIHLMVLGEIGVEITIEPSKNIENFTEFMERVEPIEEFTIINVKSSPEETKKIEELRNLFEKGSYSHEEFPIVKESVETWYKKRNVRISVRKNLDDMFSISISNDMYTSERFSDLVDLMIEARKDLLK